MSTTLSPVTAFNELQVDITRPAPSTVRVAVVGEIDLTTAPTLHDRLLTVLHEQAPALVDGSSTWPGYSASSPPRSTGQSCSPRNPDTHPWADPARHLRHGHPT
jgi:hypothetical protein